MALDLVLPRRPVALSDWPVRRSAAPNLTAAQRARLDASALALSIAAALTLVAAKGAAALATGSLAIAASLVDSLLDAAVSLGGLLTLRYAAKPADQDHRFGHRAAEDLYALAQAAMVGASAALILWSALERVGAPQRLTSEAIGLWVMGGSMLVTLGVVLWQRRVARLTGSRLVAADSAHYLADLAPAAAAMLALGVSALTGAGGLDTALAALAALWLGFTAYRIGRGAVDGLMDREAPAAIVARITAIAAEAPGLEGFHDLKTRMSGAKLFVEIHVEIDGSLTLREAHAIGERMRRRMLDVAPEVEVMVHHDPVPPPRATRQSDFERGGIASRDENRDRTTN